jgi:predicted ATPase
MLENHQADYSAPALDPDVLATPFQVQTKWHVITGAPCSGKSTLIGQLADRGFRTAAEAGRQYLERELATGRTIEEIRRDEITVFRGILSVMLEIERGLAANEVVFLDRGYPDALAFSRHVGLDPNRFLPDCFHYRYASVFMLDRFPVRLDGVRTEDEAAAAYLDEWHYRDYTALGYQVVRVPILPLQERLAFVMERLSEQELQ